MNNINLRFTYRTSIILSNPFLRQIKKLLFPLRFQAALPTTVFFSIHFFTLHLLKSNYRPTNYHHLPHHTFLSSFIIHSTPNTTRAMPVTTLSFIPPIRGSLQGSFIMFIANHLQFHKSFLGIFNINKAVMAIHTGIGILFHLLLRFLRFLYRYCDGPSCQLYQTNHYYWRHSLPPPFLC